MMLPNDIMQAIERYHQGDLQALADVGMIETSSGLFAKAHMISADAIRREVMPHYVGLFVESVKRTICEREGAVSISELGEVYKGKDGFNHVVSLEISQEARMGFKRWFYARPEIAPLLNHCRNIVGKWIQEFTSGYGTEEYWQDDFSDFPNYL